MRRLVQRDIAFCCLKGEGLRPYPILAFSERWKIIIAAVIGVDAGGDGGAVAFAETVTPPIFSPLAEVIVPVRSESA